ncbi:MAG: type II toxin-antitoxin system mRNA interferase toxin, RelE/StbE family [Deltaproteobacteria bacterium HGW-Deltaproteobacteria-23]|jgi:mRNA interferase RelE/StbE|nr:MAG: type II toxin-antitoxin system mRNA interferase toxin, RelE/StbE family [Deltaproteobacteria bacterium HGW-Deltaproteobacteria-23]
MNYELEFKESALKEWRKLDNSIRELFKKRLAERLVSPRVESSRLTGLPDCYKIKLRDAGYRLIYQICDKLVLVTVIAVGKRENNLVYRNAKERV